MLTTPPVDMTTGKMMCVSCKEGEVCLSKDGVTWTCERPENPSIPVPVMVCGPSALEVGLVKAHLAAIGLDSSSAHLADPRCSAHQERDGTVWYQVERREGSCGTTLRTNGSHAIYSNSLFVYPVGNVTFVRPLSVPFSCSYPLETDSSLGVAIRPYLAVKSAAVGQGSKVKASMTLFHNANYTEPYAMGPVTMAVGSVLHVGVSVDEKETERFVVVLDDCYATHSSKPADLMRYYLIQNGCPSDRRQVTVEESGLSLQARFSALLFLFQGDYRDVYLHCSLNLCDQRSSSCSPSCSARKRRSVTPTVTLAPLTFGPITWTES
ncbi:uromodulin-like [Osmerus eperlanus]|uniref:uromodulin-like n=1 Tax=Osmerus eperlanus TaxID=29151 RepID=UPI002E1378B9